MNDNWRDAFGLVMVATVLVCLLSYGMAASGCRKSDVIEADVALVVVLVLLHFGVRRWRTRSKRAERP
ncbi:hypothetical protein LQ948_09865 [Jiella sp. MQZ9-1]|uniref:Uncharacterized protein n=1 Tax=Jiella flava TaxID=2816857 RepID=A0A939JW34_9HYPH|nr:hypothetical protein [Jiella flava]MBO0663094.1 hypothetical protein [Jiella flava]MCD2471513.1 hypothetical protein [Jiella flava]